MIEVKIFRDGNKICALYGEDLQVGLAGFGEAIPDALKNLARAFEKAKEGFFEKEL